MEPSTSQLNLKVAIALTFLVCMFDMLIPLGIAVGAMYLFCFLFILNHPPKTIRIFSAVITFLILLKLAIFYNNQTPNIALINRGISTTIIWATTWVAIHNRKLLDRSNQEIHNKTLAIMELEQQFRKHMDSMLEGVQIIGFDWKYKYVNPSVVKQSKYHKEELIGYTMMNRYPGIEKTTMFRALERCMYGRTLERLENEFTYPDGTTGYFDLIVQPIPEGIFILSLDVSERKQAEHHRKNQIHTLEQLLFMISHKVRQPVANILGISSTLNNQSFSQQELSEISQFISESATRLDQLTRELNDLVVKSRGEQNATFN